MIILGRSFDCERIVKEIKKYPIVSFDIFDTLVLRSFAIPEDVFIRIARDYNMLHKDKPINPISFFKARKVAAVRAKEKAVELGREEIGLKDIYNCIDNQYASVSQEMLSLEVDREIICCHPNPEMKKVFEWCRKAKKEIYITSDMYLPKEAIESILRKCGYINYKLLLLSSEHNAKKYTGKLYDILAEYAKVDRSKIVHIGDNLKIDYAQAKRRGLNAILIPHDADYCTYKKSYSIDKTHRLCYRKLQKITAKNVSLSWNQYYKYGFEVIGIFLYGFITWIQGNVLKNKYNKIFFLSRDGYLMQEAYNLLYGDKAVNNGYLYVSRNSLRKPQFWMNPSFADILEPETSFHYWSFQEICELLSINENEGYKIWVKCGLNPEERMLKKELLSDKRIANFFGQVKDSIIDSSRKKYDDVIEYLIQEGFSGNIAIIDVGWAGAIQKYLNRIISASDKINADIFGYYLGFKPKTVMGSQAASYIPQKMHPSLFCSQLMEYPFTKMAGSTLTYEKREDGKVHPVLADYEFEGMRDGDITEEIQKGAMDFVRLIKSGYAPEDLDYSIAYAKLRRVSKHPSLADVKSLGELTHINHGLTCYLAKPKSIFYYTMHLSELKIDLSNSGWKIGFLKKMCYLPLPYDWFLEKVRNIVSE